MIKPKKHIFITLSILLLWLLVVCLFIPFEQEYILKSLLTISILLLLFFISHAFNLFNQLSIFQKEISILRSAKPAYSKEAVAFMEQEQASFSAQHLQENTFVRLLQIRTEQLSQVEYMQKLLREIGQLSQGVVAIYYKVDMAGGVLMPLATYALPEEFELSPIQIDDSLGGQAVKNKHMLEMNDLPEEYMHACSGQGDAKPTAVIFMPLQQEGVVLGLLEIGFFKMPSQQELQQLQDVLNELCPLINQIAK